MNLSLYGLGLQPCGPLSMLSLLPVELLFRVGPCHGSRSLLDSPKVVIPWVHAT